MAPASSQIEKDQMRSETSVPLWMKMVRRAAPR